MALNDFYAGDTKKFDVQIKKSDVLQNISDDEVWVYVKKKLTDTNADAILSSSADVTSSGSLGVAMFNLTPAKTNVTVGNYIYELDWIISGSGETYVLDQAPIRIKQKVKLYE